MLFVNSPIKDEVLFSYLSQERKRQQETLALIASENIVSLEVLKAMGSVSTNKYAEGYPGHRYYNGCECIDQIEELAIERAKKLFNCEFVNVQPHSGSQANQGVFMALLKPGDTFMGLDLAAGGHLTHGSKVNQSGKWFNAIPYNVNPDTGRIQFDEVYRLATEHKPKLIITGGSAYPRAIDFQKFREIADEVNAYLMIDIAHFAGLVAGGAHESPFPHAHVVTTTTHKTLRGARGGMIMTNDPVIAKKVNSAIFPGIQGGPLMNQIAGKAVAFYEALQPEFKIYAQQIVNNARALANALHRQKCGLVSGGTDTHLVLVDLRPFDLFGSVVADTLDRAGITCNKNSIPGDPQSPKTTSGIRLGVAALTTRGMKEREMEIIASFIMEIIYALQNKLEHISSIEEEVRRKVEDLCRKFPIYI